MNKNFEPVAVPARTRVSRSTSEPRERSRAKRGPSGAQPAASQKISAQQSIAQRGPAQLSEAERSTAKKEPPASGPVVTAPYDRELPPGYWQNLEPRKTSRRRRPVFGWVLGLSAFVLVAGALAWVTNASTHLNQNGYALPPMGAPNQEPLVASPQLSLPPAIRVPRRAALVKLPRRMPPGVRRAQLVDPPIGVSFDAHMPYGETVHCTFMGRLPSQANLPLTGAFIGETLAIGNQQFVWAAPAGGIPQWIDP